MLRHARLPRLFLAGPVVLFVCFVCKRHKLGGKDGVPAFGLKSLHLQNRKAAFTMHRMIEADPKEFMAPPPSFTLKTLVSRGGEGRHDRSNIVGQVHNHNPPDLFI